MEVQVLSSAQKIPLFYKTFYTLAFSIYIWLNIPVVLFQPKRSRKMQVFAIMAALLVATVTATPVVAADDNTVVAPSVVLNGDDCTVSVTFDPDPVVELDGNGCTASITFPTPDEE